MRYSLERVCHQIFYYRRRYLILWIELLIGAAILNLCVNMLYTSRKVLADYRESMKSERVTIDFSRKGDLRNQKEDGGYLPISYETYAKIVEEYPEVQIDYLAVSYPGIYAGEGWNDVVSMNLVFMDAGTFEDHFGVPPEPGKVYMGETVRENLERVTKYRINGDNYKVSANMQQGKEPEILYEGDTITVDGCASVPICEMPLKEGAQEINWPWMAYGTGLSPELEEASHIYLKDSLIYPAQELAKIDASRFSYWNAFVWVENKEQGIDWNALVGILKTIRKAQPLCSFRIDNDYLQLESFREDLDWTAWYWLRISAAILLLVAGSMTGVLLMLLYRRRRQEAIGYVCGGTGLRQELENVLELMLLFATAIGGGALTGYLLIEQRVITNGDIQFFTKSLWVMPFMGIIMLLFVYEITHLLKKRLSYVQVLKEE